MESLRRAYGIAEPVRRGMEMKIVKDGSFRPAVLNSGLGGNVHEEILAIGGRETEIGWEDVFMGLFYLLFFLFSFFVLSCCLDAFWFGVLSVLANLDLGDVFREPPSFHDEMEKRLRMEF